jgi:hypothetical protein
MINLSLLTINQESANGSTIIPVYVDQWLKCVKGRYLTNF